MSITGMTKHIKNNIIFYKWNVFAPWESRINAVITTRIGGSSPPPFSSLNLGHLVGDNPTALAANREAVSQALGLSGVTWAVANQVHGTRINKVENPNDSPYESCDSLSISRRMVITAIVLADCLPIVIYDPEHHTGVISHAGWKGTNAGIAEKSVQHLLDTGSRIQNLVAAVGPGIGPCCYPVDDDTAGQFSENYKYPEDVILRNKNGKFQLDLEKANLARLRDRGMKEDHIGNAGFCTACRKEEFFSYRKEGGLTGRHAALMVLL